MKVLLVATVVCLLAAGANAGAFVDTLKTIGHGFTDTFNQLFTDLKQPVTDVANGLVDNLKTAGTSLLSTGISSLLGSLSHLGETPATGTRDLSLMNGVVKFVEEGKQAVNKLSETLGGLYHAAVSRLNEIAQKIKNLDFLKEPLQNVLSEISHVVNIHDILQNSLLKNPGQFLIKAAEGLLSHKRSALLDNLANLEQQFVGLFKPVVNAVTEHVHQLGTTLTQHATSLFGAVQPLLGNLAGDLSSHVQALKDSATELLTDGQQALKNLA